MHPMTYKVARSIPALEFAQFQHLEDRVRLNEIRKLAQEQVNDDNDTSAQSSRYGKSGRANPTELPDDGQEMWPERTERELDLEAGLEPLLSSVITAEQRVLTRQFYAEDANAKEIAGRYSVTRQAIEKRIKTIHGKLREALLLAYGPPKKEGDEDGTDESG